MIDICIDTWVSGYKVQAFPWVDGASYYVNIQYFSPGSSLSKPPVFDKTVYITGNDNGYKILSHYLHTLVEHISRMNIIPGNKYILTF